MSRKFRRARDVFWFHVARQTGRLATYLLNVDHGLQACRGSYSCQALYVYQQPLLVRNEILRGKAFGRDEHWGLVGQYGSAAHMSLSVVGEIGRVEAVQGQRAGGIAANFFF